MPAAPRVLVTRAPHQASALADRLRDLGCEPILIPTIETVAPTSFEPLDEALNKLDTFHWFLFTSANAVEAFAYRLPRHELQVAGAGEGHGFSRAAKPSAEKRALAPEVSLVRPRIAAIGPATAHALEQLGLIPDLIPPQAIAESLTAALLLHARQPDGTPTRFLLVRAEEAREHLPEALRAAGAEVTIAPAYRTIFPEGAAKQLRRLLAEEPPDAITFTSSSTARNLFALVDATGIALPSSVVRASIGPVTSATLEELGYPSHVEAPEATVAALAEMLVEYLRHLREH